MSSLKLEHQLIVRYELTRGKSVKQIADQIGVRDKYIYRFIQGERLTLPRETRSLQTKQFSRGFHRRLLDDYLASPEANRPRVAKSSKDIKVRTNNPIDEMPRFPTQY